MKHFNPSSPHPDRAVQAWIILIGAAMHRETLTYEGLSMLMYRKKAQGVLNKILGHIAFYCNDNKFPPLTSIVVGKGRGTPGANIPINLNELDSERERVFAFDWYDVYPPSDEEMQESYYNNIKKAPKK